MKLWTSQQLVVYVENLLKIETQLNEFYVRQKYILNASTQKHDITTIAVKMCFHYNSK